MLKKDHELYVSKIFIVALSHLCRFFYSCCNIAKLFLLSGWHICSVCQKASHYMCYTCTYSLCKGCTKNADYFHVRGKKGFCSMCMRTIMLIENKDQGNNEKVYHMRHGVDRFLILHASLKEGALLVLSLLGTICLLHITMSLESIISFWLHIFWASKVRLVCPHENEQFYSSGTGSGYQFKIANFLLSSVCFLSCLAIFSTPYIPIDETPFTF